MNSADVRVWARAVSSAQDLSSYNIDASKVTVGGLSSGGFMAVQMQVAYSSMFSASSVWAGGPFYCAQDSESTALTTCMNPIMSAPNAGSLGECWHAKRVRCCCCCCCG